MFEDVKVLPTDTSPPMTRGLALPAFRPEIFIRRCNGSRETWGAFCGEKWDAFIIHTSMSLDGLVAELDRRYPEGWRALFESGRHG